MTSPSQRLSAPDIDSVAFATALAAYQRTRRLLAPVPATGTLSAHLPSAFRPDDFRGSAGLDAMHESRIARARLRHVIASFVADAVRADVPKSSVVRRMNDQVNALVRSAVIESDASLVSELIDWIVEGYPDDLAVERSGRGRLTPAHSRDVIPIHLLSAAERAG